MLSANLTTARIKKIAFIFSTFFIYSFAAAQENSPYSRYGLGDIVPMQNMVSRSMGGISAGFIDSANLPFSQSVNLANPASLGSLNTTLFDIGGEIDIHTLRSNNSPDKYTATNTIISYFQLGFPITSKRMIAKGNYWNIAFGLRPVTKVNYRILANSRIAGLDSVSSLFEGNGGLNQANFSTGIKIKNFSIGISTGYSFGNRETSTKIGFNNDSVKYMQSNTEADAHFSGGFLNVGVQYGIRLPNKAVLRLGATANLQQELRAKRNLINETFVYDGNGVVVGVDTVTALVNQKGTVTMPASYTAGVTYTNSHWIFGADVGYSAWSQYRYFGAEDAVDDNVTVRIGGQYYPASPTTPAKKYWSFVKYRAGAFYGNDFVKLNSTRPEFGITLGAGLPLTSFQRLRFGEFVTLNTGVEIGQRGNKDNVSVRENIYRLTFGVSMTAAWFQKRKYD